MMVIDEDEGVNVETYFQREGEEGGGCRPLVCSPER